MQQRNVCLLRDSDMEEEMRKRNIPLFSLETRTPIKDFDVLALHSNMR